MSHKKYYNMLVKRKKIQKFARSSQALIIPKVWLNALDLQIGSIVDLQLDLLNNCILIKKTNDEKEVFLDEETCDLKSEAD